MKRIKKQNNQIPYILTDEGKPNVYRHVIFIAMILVGPLAYMPKITGGTEEMFRIGVGMLLIVFGFILGIRVKKTIALIKKDQDSGKRRLIQTGVFAVCRHPLYVVQTFLVVAMVITFPSVFMMLTSLIYLYDTGKTIKEEEKVLEKVFKKKFLAYKRRVPIFPLKFWKLYF